MSVEDQATSRPVCTNASDQVDDAGRGLELLNLAPRNIPQKIAGHARHGRDVSRRIGRCLRDKHPGYTEQPTLGGLDIFDDLTLNSLGHLYSHSIRTYAAR